MLAYYIYTLMTNINHIIPSGFTVLSVLVNTALCLFYLVIP